VAGFLYAFLKKGGFRSKTGNGTKRKKEVAVLKITAVFSDKEESRVRLLIEEDSGMAEQKTVRLSEFKGILDVSHDSKSDMVPIGTLPKGYFDGQLVADDRTSFIMTICVASSKRHMNYYNELFHIPFPALMFKFQIKKGHVIVSEVFSLDTDRPSETSKLYRYPYGNVYDDGRICWGSNALKPVLQKKDLNHLVAMFFCSGTNDDLFKSSAYGTQRALLTHLKGKEKFPQNLLVENSKYANVGAMLN